LGPGIGFGDLLDDGVALAEQAAHVAGEDEALGEWAEQGDGGGEAEVVAHAGGAAGEREEEVVVLHEGEGAGEHGVLKGVGRVEAGDLRGEALADAEVAGAPGDAVAESHEAGGATSLLCDGLFAGVDVPEEMNLDGTGEVEDAGERCVDEGGFG